MNFIRLTGRSPRLSNSALTRFLLGIVTSFFGGIVGVLLAWLIIVFQNSYSLILVPGTSIPYPISFTISNVLIVLTTIIALGVITSLWSTIGLKED